MQDDGMDRRIAPRGGETPCDMLGRSAAEVIENDDNDIDMLVLEHLRQGIGDLLERLWFEKALRIENRQRRPLAVFEILHLLRGGAERGEQS